MTAIYKIPEADGSALSAVSEAAYLLLSDGCDVFNVPNSYTKCDNLQNKRGKL